MAAGVGIAAGVAAAALALGESSYVTHVTSGEQESSMSFVRSAGVFLTATAYDGQRVGRNLAALTVHVERYCPLLMAQQVEGRPVEARAKAAVLAQAVVQALVAVTIAMRQPVRTFVREVQLLRWGDTRTMHAIYGIVRADETALTLHPSDLCADARTVLASHNGELPSSAQQSVTKVEDAFPDGSLADMARLLPGIADSGRPEADELQRLEHALQVSIAPRISRGLSRLDASLGLSGVSMGGMESVPAMPVGR